LHCETNYAGLVMYRERHACDCPTKGRAVSARRIDDAVGELLADLPRLCHEATPTERRSLLGPLVEHVSVDVGTKRLVGVTQTGLAAMLTKVA